MMEKLLLEVLIKMLKFGKSNFFIFLYLKSTNFFFLILIRFFFFIIFIIYYFIYSKIANNNRIKNLLYEINLHDRISIIQFDEL